MPGLRCLARHSGVRGEAAALNRAAERNPYGSRMGVVSLQHESAEVKQTEYWFPNLTVQCTHVTSPGEFIRREEGWT